MRWVGSTGRRELFQQSIGAWLEKTMEATAERVSVTKLQRPPGALPEVGFLAACTRCGDCVAACPPHAIIKATTASGLAAGTPYIDPAVQPCTVCPDMPCVAACPTEALTLPPAGWSGYRLAALEFIPERCVTYRGTTCDACARACPVGEAALTIDEAGHPVLRIEGCVGCGVCVRGCITYPSSFALKPLNR